MTKNGPKQSRHWCVTVNAKKDDGGEWTHEAISGFGGVDDTLEHLREVSQLRYAVYSVERGTDAEVDHLQMYVEFMRPKRMSEAKQVLGWTHAHLEPRWGSRTQARDYCMKVDETHIHGPVEIGIWRLDAEGLKGLNRSLADLCVDLILQGKDPHAVAREAPAAFFAHHRKVWALWNALRCSNEKGEW